MSVPFPRVSVFKKAEERCGTRRPLDLLDASPLGVLTRMLLALGLDVLAAANGFEALALTRHPARPIDLVVTDVRMPGMGGPG